MANWCNNYLILSGTAAAIEDSVKIFTKIEEEQNRTGKYYLPEFVTAESSNMTDIIVVENTINYQTRWVPNLEALVQIAKHTGVDFASQYDELQMGIIGEATYQTEYFRISGLTAMIFSNTIMTWILQLIVIMERIMKMNGRYS
jgi:hypothetical protein